MLELKILKVKFKKKEGNDRMRTNIYIYIYPFISFWSSGFSGSTNLLLSNVSNNEVFKKVTGKVATDIIQRNK